MRRTLALTAVAAFAAAALLSSPQAASAWTGEAYVDGSVTRVNGTGTATGTSDGDPDGEVAVSAESVGGTRFRIPVLNALPYSTPTTTFSRVELSDGVPGFPGVEAGQDYLVTVTYADLDVETSTTGSGTSTTELYAQAGAGSDGSGHALVAGARAQRVTQDGAAVLEFEFHATQDSPLGIQAGLRVSTAATGAGNQANASLSGVVSDVQVTEVG